MAHDAGSDAEGEYLAADQLKRFPVLIALRIAELEAAGFEVVPAFRRPHVTIAFGQLDAGLAVQSRYPPAHERLS